MLVPTSAQLHAYASIPQQIQACVAELDSEQLQATPQPGEWSIQQVLIHLADSEAIGYERLRRIIAENQAQLLTYDESGWSQKLFYHQQDPQLALELFTLLRRANAALLNLLPAETWERTGQHEESGEMSLYAAFQVYLNHALA